MSALANLLAGALFGAGLVVSGMTDAARVQGWLDLLGDWDPTLAFVLGGAIAPMALAWRAAARRERALLGAPMPGRPDPAITPRLLGGSALFGLGWALVGLCPGPALAVAGYGGWPALLFLAAMAAGMMAAPRLGMRRAAA